MTARVVLPLLRTANSFICKETRRTFLSAAYRCEEVWNKRLQHPLLTKINLSEFGYELDQKYKAEGKVSAIDVDLFMNRVEKQHVEGLAEEIEELVHRLRRSPETVRTLPSTPHAVIRLLLEADCTQLLLKMVSDPMNYGVFPDTFTSNLLMDTFLQGKQYTAAAQVASQHMLQEDFGSPLTQGLVLASCYAFLTSDNTQPWQDFSPTVEEPQEEVKIRVRYLRNPYFDDHFDLKDPNHIVGKTLAWLAPLLRDEVRLSCQVAGWALYNKWDQLETALDQAVAGGHPLAAIMVNKAKEAVEAGAEGDTRERLQGRLEAVEGQVTQQDLWPLITRMVEEAVTHEEQALIHAQAEQYRAWEEQRQQEYQEQLYQYQKRQLLAEVEAKKEQLQQKEEVIYFFDNQDKLELLLPEKRFYPKRKSLIYGKKKVKKVDEDYIPPEVSSRPVAGRTPKV